MKRRLALFAWAHRPAPVPNGTRKHTPSERYWSVLLGVWLVAFWLRCIYLWQISHAPFFHLRIGDAEAYHLWARRIAEGDWIGQGVFYQAPLYPYVLGVIYRILGDSIITVRLIQAFIGAASCSLLAATGMSLFGLRGAIAGLGLAIYPTAIFLDGLVEKSSLVTFFTAALLALVAVPQGRMTVRRLFATGMILGLLALTRENALLLAAPVLLWIGKMGRESFSTSPATKTPVPVLASLVFVAGCALILLPVGLRNLAVGGEFHLTTSQFGPNFYIGNHSGADGTYEALVAGHGSAADERKDATRLAELAAGRTLSPEEVSNFWTERSLAYIRSQPLDWLKLMARKLALAFNASQLSDTESQDVYAEWSSLLRMLRPFDFGVLFGMAALGTVLTAGPWRRLWLFYAIGGTYALSVIIFYVFERYRFPVVPVLLILAAGGLQKGTGIFFARSNEKDSRPRLRLAVAATAAVLAVAFAHVPLDDERGSRAAHFLGIASVLSEDPARHEQAMGFYRRALDEAPKFPGAQFGLGMLLARMGRPEEAIPYYRAVLESWPNLAEARYNLGLALAATGRAQEASEQYGEALRIRPDDADTYLAAAKTLLAVQRPDLAVQRYQQIVALQPKNAQALVGLGVALTLLGRPEEAIEKYRLALELDPQEADAHSNLGWTLASSGRFAEAVPHFELALALNPGDENARRNLAQVRQALAK